MSPKKRTLWGTKFGFYLAAVGSAFGLGNLWRFPYVTVENGGGAFVFLYVLFAFALGLPLLIGELMLGKLTRRSVISACQRVAVDEELSNRAQPAKDKTTGWVWIGRFSVLTCLLILAYYAVISGWVLHFLMQFFFGRISSSGFDVEKSLMILRENGVLQIALMSVHILITLVIVIKGVQEGIEKWVGNIMPIFIGLLVILAMKSLSLPSATDALRFMFYPNFASLTVYSPLHAVGHVLFTLSIGIGTMVTFGSYLNDQTRIPAAGFRVTTMDTMISLFAGLLVFPLLVGLMPSKSGPELLFQTLPRLLADLDSGFFFGVTFFICLYMAALAASIGLLESVVSNLLDFTKLTRSQAAWATGVAACAVGIVPALSTSTFAQVSYRGLGFFELLDSILINGVLPLSALGVSWLIARKLKRERAEEEFVNDETIATQTLYSHWNFVMRYLARGIILGSIILALLGFFNLL